MLDLLEVADRLFRKHDCGSLEISETSYIMTLTKDGWAKAQPALRGLYAYSPRIEVRPRFSEEEPMEYEYTIWKAKTAPKRHAQKMSIASAAMMAAEKLSPDVFYDTSIPAN